MNEERFYVEGGNHGLWLARDRERPGVMRAFEDQDTAQHWCDHQTVRTRLSMKARIEVKIKSRIEAGVAPRYQVRGNDAWEGWIVFDHLQKRTAESFYSRRYAEQYCFRKNNEHYDSLKEGITMNEDRFPHERAPFYVFSRAVAHDAFKPTGFSGTEFVTQEGARRILETYLKRFENINIDTLGTFLVQSPRGAWTFTVAPPAPAPLVITAV